MHTRTVKILTALAGVLLMAAAPPAPQGEWLTYGLTPGETRYSPLKQINDGNVSRLGLAWSYDVGPGGGNQEATPLVFERHDLLDHQLEHRVRRRRAHRKGALALGSRSQPDCGVPEDLLRRGESRPRDLQEPDHRAHHRRPAGSAECDDRESRLGNARGVSAGELHPHDGAAHRQGQSDHRRGRRRVSGARLLRRLRCRDRPVRVEVLHRSRRSVEALRERRDEEGCRDLGAASGGRSAAAARCGMAWPTIRRPIWFTSAPATAGRGPKNFAQSKGKDNLYVASVLAVKARHRRD